MRSEIGQVLSIAIAVNDLFTTPAQRFDMSRSERKVYKCALSGSRLYVTNDCDHKLLTLSMDATVLSSLDDPAFCAPSAVHLSESGLLLVCGQYLNNLVHVDGEREW
ncbi:hypothetical protein DPMN_092255 [Dreissena polymorpha]|uniref:Uncharacterized protein n=1 Tax=Dreissena polymorpha TaxID=45954 RepID=A0A9D4L3L1_DREPO|nr:hypothetical protein DPMN_092255 [Dreissena polymorpha]